MSRRFAATVLTLALLGGACGGDSPLGADAPSELEGLVIAIDSPAIGEVNSFTLKDGDQTYEIRIDPERDYGFNLSHLQEHRQNLDPVVVALESRDGFLFATSIEDS